MITRSDALKNQKCAKNSSKMIKFPCDISPCNIPSVLHAIWVAAILRYTISRCISVWVPIVFMCRIAKWYFFAISHIACCIGVRSLEVSSKIEMLFLKMSVKTDECVVGSQDWWMCSRQSRLMNMFKRTISHDNLSKNEASSH